MATDGTGTRTVVITGASTGIGEACALRLDKAGWRVFAGVRKDADAERLRQQASDRLTTVMLDVTNQAQIEAAERIVGEAAGAAGLAGLVNNAGVSFNGPLEFLPIEDLRQQLEVNTIGQLAVTQAFLPLLRKARGRIVNITSIGGRATAPFLGPYSASKHAMEALSDALRQELRPWKMHVAIVEPGSIATRIWEKAYAGADELQEKLPEEAMMLYGKAVEAMRKAAARMEAAGIPPDRVARAVEHALTSARPRTRYVVGFDATMQRLLDDLLPDRLMDAFTARFLGLPRKPSGPE
jgi:NAD(P)-dependent dehydrogenase (short-subunit alcohol dehydrogenase family)